jgi:hypothetical protein
MKPKACIFQLFSRGSVTEAKLMRDLEKRYNVVLELLGEKTERISELEADISEMKQVFKEQLEAALSKISK